MFTYNAQYLKEKLQKELNPLVLQIDDVSNNCGAKFVCLVVSEQFVGKSLLARHRMVNNILSEELKSIHAFSLKTYTKEQFDKLNKK